MFLNQKEWKKSYFFENSGLHFWSFLGRILWVFRTMESFIQLGDWIKLESTPWLGLIFDLIKAAFWDKCWTWGEIFPKTSIICWVLFQVIIKTVVLLVGTFSISWLACDMFKLFFKAFLTIWFCFLTLNLISSLLLVVDPLLGSDSFL